MGNIITIAKQSKGGCTIPPPKKKNTSLNQFYKIKTSLIGIFFPKNKLNLFKYQLSIFHRLTNNFDMVILQF